MSLEDVLIRRRIFTQRFAGSQAAKAEKTLLGIMDRARARLLEEPTELQSGRLATLINDISILNAKGFDDLNVNSIADIVAFAEDELAFVVKATGQHVNVSLNTPAFGQVEQAITSAGMDAPIGPEKISMRDAFDTFSSKKASEIQQVISDGFLDGRTTDQIARDLASLSDRQRSQVKTLVRTSTNHAANQVHKAFSEANSDVLLGDEWVATLDSNTTLICGGRDGMIFPIGEGPFPPAHFNCRSLRISKVKDEFAVDDTGTKRPEVGADGPGQVTGQTKFDGWLRRQPADFQDEYFSRFTNGKQKAALFRRGKLGIQQFRDEDGVNFTLDQLRAREPLAFGKANLQPAMGASNES